MQIKRVRHPCCWMFGHRYQNHEGCHEHGSWFGYLALVCQRCGHLMVLEDSVFDVFGNERKQT